MDGAGSRTGVGDHLGGEFSAGSDRPYLLAVGEAETFQVVGGHGHPGAGGQSNQRRAVGYQDAAVVHGSGDHQAHLPATRFGNAGRLGAGQFGAADDEHPLSG